VVVYLIEVDGDRRLLAMEMDLPVAEPMVVKPSAPSARL
jgi:hypothetical protein